MPQTTDHQERDFGAKLEFDKNFDGPRKKRSCTDVICLLLFIVFLAAWGFVAYFAYRHGDINRILVPTDSQGLQCGVDSQVLGKPYLMFFDLQKCIDPLVPIHGCPTPQVCVEQCPQTTFSFGQCNAGNFAEIKRQLICTRQVRMDQIAGCSDVETLLASDECAQWYLKSESFLNRCVSLLPSTFCLHVPKRWIDVLRLAPPTVTTDPASAVPDKCTENRELGNALLQEKMTKSFLWMQESQKVIADITAALIPIGVALLISMLCCLIVITMMRWMAGPLLWFSILGVIGVLAFGIYWSQKEYRYFVANPPLRPDAGTNLQAIFNNYMHSKTTWLVILILLSVLLVVLLLVLLVLRKRIQIAIALVKEGSKAVSSAYTTVFFPIFPWILQIATIAFAIVVGMMLLSVGEQQFQVVGMNGDSNCACTGPAADYKDGGSCDPKVFQENCQSTTSNGLAATLRNLLQGDGDQGTTCAKAACFYKSIEQPTVVPYFHAINVVGFFWLVFFISALGEMVLAAVFATWFWSFKKSNVPFFTLTRALGRTVRYHLGTVAFGSLILTICRLIRVILAYIQKQLKAYDNVVTRAILCCMQCFFWCLEKFLVFLNRNAYIMCAIHGKNFCTSAKDAFELLMRNMLRVFALDQVTGFLFFMAKVLVTLGMGASMYFYLEYRKHDVRLNYLVVPAAVVMVGTYLISTVFFSVYSMAVDTLFLCFLEDSERNDGSAEKPYFMSKSLMRILGKHNDVSKQHYRD